MVQTVVHLFIFITGIMKAHMKNLGDTDGPAMDSNLSKCMKAIGSKLATDGYKQVCFLSFSPKISLQFLNIDSHLAVQL